MRVLPFSMPEAFEQMNPVSVRMPNGALTSLAGTVGADHAIALADLIFAIGFARYRALGRAAST
jgi:hypothetical protein